MLLLTVIHFFIFALFLYFVTVVHDCVICFVCALELAACYFCCLCGGFIVCSCVHSGDGGGSVGGKAPMATSSQILQQHLLVFVFHKVKPLTQSTASTVFLSPPFPVQCPPCLTQAPCRLTVTWASFGVELSFPGSLCPHFLGFSFNLDSIYAVVYLEWCTGGESFPGTWRVCNCLNTSLT